MNMKSERKVDILFYGTMNRNQETSMARKCYADCISTKIYLKIIADNWVIM